MRGPMLALYSSLKVWGCRYKRHLGSTFAAALVRCNNCEHAIGIIGDLAMHMERGKRVSTEEIVFMEFNVNSTL